MPNTDIDQKIDELLDTIHREELELAESRYSDETAACLTFARTRALALDLRSASEVESGHLRSCPHCAARLQSFRAQIHPAPLKLVLFKLGRLVGEESHLVRNHLNDGCVQCGRFLTTRWAEKASSAIETGWRTVGQLAETFSQAIWEVLGLPTLSFYYESGESRRVPFSARVKQDDLSLMMEETDSDELFIRVFTEDASLENRHVHIEVIGGERPLEAEVRLTAAGECYQGIHYFPNFGLLSESGAIMVLAVPASEGKAPA
jgi:hypothetical protein